MDDARIEQFRKMAEADPENELGHFSLGKALLDAGKPAEAVASLERVIDLNAQHSKAYHLLAVAQKASGDSSGALSTLRIGFEVAHGRGDLMPRNDMAAMLREMGEEPSVADAGAPAAAPVAVGEGEVMCRRCGRAGPSLPARPFKGPQGEKILATVCAACWREWILMGTKVINELRLNFADPRQVEMYDQHMKEFLNLD